MISSSLTKDKVKEREYPYLGINKDSLVVLFNKECRGVLVHAGSVSRTGPGSKIGEFSNRWKEGSFEVCTHTVHLKMTSNELFSQQG